MVVGDELAGHLAATVRLQDAAAGSSEREAMVLHATFAYPDADTAAAARVTPGVMSALTRKWKIEGVAEDPTAMWHAIQQHENAQMEPSGPWSHDAW
eukprot:COSAG02_NODE_2731_length_8142_cov_5.041775_2_plen_97_part_00